MGLGAKTCDKPCWEPQFQTADLFILLRREALCPRYARHFKCGHVTTDGTPLPAAPALCK